MRSSFSEADIRDVSLLPGVKGVMGMGSVLSVELIQSRGSTYDRPPVDRTLVLTKNEFGPSLGISDSDSGSDSNSDSDSNSITSGVSNSETDSANNAASTPNKNERYYNSNASSVVVSLLKANNIYARPLGNVVYLMPTPLTPEADRDRLIRVIKRLGLGLSTLSLSLPVSLFLSLSLSLSHARTNTLYFYLIPATLKPYRFSIP
jgi:hypothetical protein